MTIALLPKALQLSFLVILLTPALEASGAPAALCQGKGFSKTRSVKSQPSHSESPSINSSKKLTVKEGGLGSQREQQ